ncbi:MAG: FKBP-type peptidyl-prolyl cis-trans isomerase [Saprospiraceae bacterium]|nr:FKBP-type peptidyl-prolyl cis-trans isomerase [Saprospiraceae bacterium]
MSGILILLFNACNNDGYTKSATGLKYRIVESHNGRKPVLGEMMRLHLKYKDKNGKVIYDSGILGEAFVLQLESPSFTGGLEDGFAMMGEGDSATFIVSADSVFEKTFRQNLPATIQKGEFLQFDVKMIKVLTKSEFEKESTELENKIMDEEIRRIEIYLTENNISILPVEKGIYFIVLKEGEGQKPMPGDSVEISYTGSFLNGEVFDGSSKKGTNLQYLFGDGKRLPAWESAIFMMKEGSVARLILTSKHTYGKIGHGPVPPDTPVVFDIELLKVASSQKE